MSLKCIRNLVRVFLGSAFFAAAVSLFPAAASAQTIASWKAGGGRWETGTNWSGNVAPSTNYVVFVTNTTTKTVTIDLTTTTNASGIHMTVSNLTLSGPVSSTNTLFLNNAGTTTPLRILNAATISAGGVLLVTNSAFQVDGLDPGGGDVLIDGSVTLSDGSSTIATNSVTCTGNTGSGNLTVFGGSMLVNVFRVGNAAGSRGTVTASGGTITCVGFPDGIELGKLGGSTGTVWLTGGRLVATNNTPTVVGDGGVGQMTVSNGTALLGAVYVGFSAGSAGTLTMAGGTNQLSSLLYLGRLSGATGAVWVTGGRLVVTNAELVVGQDGVGRLTVSNGTALLREVYVGYSTGSQGTLTIAGGTNSLSSELSAGTFAGATGTVWLTGGQLFTTIAISLIGHSGVGRMTVSNGTWQASSAAVGFYAGSQGTLTIAGGTNSLSSSLSAGAFAGATGTVWLTGGQLFTTNYFSYIGDNGVGRMTVSNGTWQASSAVVGFGDGSQGTLTVAGGTTLLSSDLTIGRDASATGTVTVAGGSLSVTNAAGSAKLIVGQSGRGIYTQNGGTVSVDKLVVTNNLTDAVFQLNSGTFFTKTSVYSNLVLNVGASGNSATLNFQGATHSLLDALILAPSAGTTGTVWMTASQLMVGRTDIGLNGSGQMTVSNGTWQVGGLARVGVFAGSRGTLTIAGGTSSVFSNLTIGNFPCTPTGTVVVAGGSLFVTNSTASAVLEVRTGSLILNSGTLTIDSLVITNSCGNLALNGGALNTGSTTINNGSIVNVGNGSNVTIMHLTGGIHSFANNLRIRNNATLSGCGSVTGNVLVDVGGMVLADCGGVLNFSGTVTNNGSIVAANGTVLNFFGPVVNNGVIDGINGTVEFYGGVVNNGTIIPNSWTDGNGKWETPGNWSAGSAPSTNDPADFITKAGNNTVTVDATTAGSFPATLTISNLVLSAPVGSTNTLALNVGGTNTPLRVLNRLTLDGRGVLTVSNSALRSDGDLSIGLNGSSNQLTITTGSRLDSVNSIIGSNATANGNTVIVTGTNSLWNTTNLVIGVAGSGNLLSISNAARVSISGTFTVGSGPSISGNRIETVDGGVLEVAQAVSVGGTNSGQATFQVTGGTTILSSNLVAGSSVGSTGIVTVTDGGQLVVTNGVFAVGNDGSLFSTGGVGHVTVSSGLVEAASILIGDRTGSDSSFTVSSNGHVLVRGGLRSNGIKTTTINGGTLEVVIGPPPPFEDPALHDRIVVSYLGDGKMIVSNGTVRGLEMVIGLASGSGTLEMAGGSVNLSSNLLVGMNSTATGMVTITGGSLIVTNGVFAVGNNGTVGGAGGLGRVAVSNGLVEAASILIGDSANDDSGFTVASNGYVRVHGGLRSNGIKTTTINGGTLEVVAGPPPPFEDPALHDRIAVAYLGDGRMILSNGTVRGLEMVVGLLNGRGTFEMAGGTVNLSSNLLVGMNASATGDVFITGGTVTVTNGVFAVGNNGTVGGVGGLGHVAVSNGTVDAASILVGDITGGDSGLTVAGSGHVRAHGGLRSNGIKTTLVNGGTLEVVDGPPQPFEHPILHDRIVVSYLADGKLVVSNGTVRTPGMLVGASAGNTGTMQLAGGSTSVFSNMTVGFIACTSTGIVTVTGGNLSVTNGGTAVLEVRSGTFTLSSGTMTLDVLVITNACGHFARNGGSLSIGTLVLDSNFDADGDGIPNGYEQSHGLDPLNGVNATLDSDGDGLTDLQEFQAGTDATNSVSAFRITSVARIGPNMVVTWMTGLGRTNALQFASGASYNTNFSDVTIITNTTTTITNATDFGGATNIPSRFYRVRLVP